MINYFFSFKTEKIFFWLIISLMVLLFSTYLFFPLLFEAEINSVANEMNIDPSLIAAVIKLESDFDDMALSHSGAFGLMQLMPQTANWLKNQCTIQGSWREPLNNIKLGTFYLQQLFFEFDKDIHHTLNAYHMGPNRLRDFLQENEDFRHSNYTKRIVLYQMIYKILYDGFFIYPGE